MEAVAQKCSGKKVFLKILQNSQENTYVEVSLLNKVAGLMPATLLKKRFMPRIFPVNFEKICRTSFIYIYRTPPVATSEIAIHMQKAHLRLTISIKKGYNHGLKYSN